MSSTGGGLFYDGLALAFVQDPVFAIPLDLKSAYSDEAPEYSHLS
jgi:hypothetical protein